MSNITPLKPQWKIHPAERVLRDIGFHELHNNAFDALDEMRTFMLQLEPWDLDPKVISDLLSGLD